MTKGKVIIAIPVLLQDGTEVQTLAFVRVLNGAGYSITVCCYHEHDQGMVDAMRHAGANVIIMNRRSSMMKMPNAPGAAMSMGGNGRSRVSSRFSLVHVRNSISAAYIRYSGITMC
jgi:hypothetical protein